MNIDPFSIILEMLAPLPIVWLALILSRKKVFPNTLPKEGRLRKRVTPFIISALAVGAFGRALTRNPNLTNSVEISVFLLFLSTVASYLMIFGCANLAYKKGHHWGWGFLGTFSLLGLVVVALLKDRPVEEKKSMSASNMVLISIGILCLFIGGGSWVVFNRFAGNAAEKYPLNHAAAIGNTVALQRLFEEGKDLNQATILGTPLTSASHSGEIEAVKFLL